MKDGQGMGLEWMTLQIITKTKEETTKMKKTFNPSDFIVTKEGKHGYVVRKLVYEPNMYEIRLASGLTVRNGEDLILDPTDWDEEMESRNRNIGV
jgi:hypothetical protein